MKFIQKHQKGGVGDSIGNIFDFLNRGTSVKSNEKWSRASLRITSQSKSAAEITKLLRTEPSEAYEKGASLSRTNPQSPARQESLWVLESGLHESQPLEAHITKLLSFIERNLSVLKDLLLDCEIDLFCGFSSSNGQGGFVLTSDLLKRITVLPIDIVLDLYPPEKDEE